MALLTAEAEYVPASIGGKEILWLVLLTGEIGLPEFTIPMQMNMNNQAAIQQAEKEFSSIQTKHMDVSLKLIGDF